MCGLAVGYPDPDFPANKLHIGREAIEKNVVFLDKRIQTMDSPETRPIFTAEKKSLIIDWLVKWRIAAPRSRRSSGNASRRCLGN